MRPPLPAASMLMRFTPSTNMVRLIEPACSPVDLANDLGDEYFLE